MKTEGKNFLWNEFWKNREFWKDVALVAALVAVIYAVYIAVEYWPEITEGFKRGWNSR